MVIRHYHHLTRNDQRQLSRVHHAHQLIATLIIGTMANVKGLQDSPDIITLTMFHHARLENAIRARRVHETQRSYSHIQKNALLAVSASVQFHRGHCASHSTQLPVRVPNAKVVVVAKSGIGTSERSINFLLCRCGSALTMPRNVCN